MRSKKQSLSLLFRTINLALIAALLVAVAVTPARAQKSAPATAGEAAKMPEYAARLAHRAKAQATLPKSVSRATHRGPLQANDIYDNGPTNGNTDGWNFGFGFVVSDTFTVVSSGTPVTRMTFAAWLFPGDVLPSVTLGITSTENSGTVYFNQTLSITQSGCVVNSLGFDICNETTSAFNVTLNTGTYWVNLQNGEASDDDSVYWDENSGIGCTSQGCPSSASATSIGTIPSESFTILGSGTTTSYDSNFSCPGQQEGFQELQSLGPFNYFDPPSGVAINRAGNIFGTLPIAGNYAQGLIYELAQRAGHWVMSTLYNFLGGSSGSSPNGVIAGPEGDVFGAATGGIQNCGTGGTSYCGLIYEAGPPANICTNATCSNEATIYQFTSNTDAWNGKPLFFDSAGNLYGISGPGGPSGNGAVFELAPAQGGWTEKILYSFTGVNNGWPGSLLLGHDGNFYGTAGGGLYGYGVVFQLVPSGIGWTENVLYNFTGANDGASPGNPVQDSAGNMYGISTCNSTVNFSCMLDLNRVGLIFKLSFSGSGWTFNVIDNAFDVCGLDYSIFHALTVDEAGNLYAATGATDIGYGYGYYCGAVVKVADNIAVISGNADIFYNVTPDTNGNLYGTTASCDLVTPQRNDAMVWRASP